MGFKKKKTGIPKRNTRLMMKVRVRNLWSFYFVAKISSFKVVEPVTSVI